MAKSKYKREHYLISKEIQGAYMVSFLVPLTIMLIIMSLIFVFALRSGVTSSLETVNRDVNDRLATSLIGKDQPTVRDYKNAIDDVRQMLNGGDSKINRNKNVSAIVSSMMYILIPGFLLAIIELVFLTVFFSHKIAGPVFRIELACKRIIDGDYKEEIHLRDGDKMKNLATLFNQMTVITKERLEKALNLQNEEQKEDFRLQNKLNP
jgi:nitrate/nitrite-specific signal transduction histidine kinase